MNEAIHSSDHNLVKVLTPMEVTLSLTYLLVDLNRQLASTHNNV